MSKQTYPSKYTDKMITSSQYLTDFIMERIAAKEKTTLTYKYWNNERWKKIFLRQLAEANKLLKEANCIAIMTFLRSVKGKNIYSLGLKKQIIDGTKSCIDTYWQLENVSSNYTELDLFIEQIPEEEIDIKLSETKSNLWEKLG